jgi:hypothetical protein
LAKRGIQTALSLTKLSFLMPRLVGGELHYNLSRPVNVTELTPIKKGLQQI